MNVKTVISGHEMTPRQGEVLEAALNVLVKLGSKMTMSAVATEASCSKETLYNWFGDRDGLLRATVQWQASKVREPVVNLSQINANSLANALNDFAADLLGVLASDISVALNRVAISGAGAKSAELGAVVLENGRLAMGRRLKPVIEAGRAADLLKFEDSEQAFRSFFGLVVRDVQLRLLLGQELKLSEKQIRLDADLATSQFLTLYKI